MANPAGESSGEFLRFDFNRRLMVQFRGSVVDVPLTEVLTFDRGKLAAHKDELLCRVDKPATPPGASAYKPSAVRREGRKLDTQKQYAAWQKSYKELKRNRRGMSDVWYLQQIAQQDIANNRYAETIRNT